MPGPENKTGNFIGTIERDNKTQRALSKRKGSQSAGLCVKFRKFISAHKTRPVLLRSAAHRQPLMIYTPSLHHTDGRILRLLHLLKWCTEQRVYVYNPDACE